jgi:hypothetical protein
MGAPELRIEKQFADLGVAGDQPAGGSSYVRAINSSEVDKAFPLGK